MLRFWFGLSANENGAPQLEPARPGRDGWVELAFDAALRPGRMDADGYMDFLDRGLLTPVVAGQRVARVHPPEDGEPPGAPARLELGSGVEQDGSGVVFAKRDGVVRYSPGGSLDVVDRHVHQGAIDLHTGHLEMTGCVTVRGDVERLLHVHATSDVEVIGSVSGAIRAGGSVRVTGNVRGGDGARLVAAGDINLRSCESAEVVAAAALRVRDAVNSRLVGREVAVTGRLRGGSVSAELSILAKEAGTAAGTVTLLRAGEPVEMPGPDDVQRAVLMQKLRRMAERGGVREASGVRGDARGKGGKMGRTQAALSAEAARELGRLAQRRQHLARQAFLQIGVAHPGVELSIGAARLVVQQTTPASRYTWDPQTGTLRAERTRA